MSEQREFSNWTQREKSNILEGINFLGINCIAILRKSY